MNDASQTPRQRKATITYRRHSRCSAGYVSPGRDCVVVRRQKEILSHHHQKEKIIDRIMISRKHSSSQKGSHIKPFQHHPSISSPCKRCVQQGLTLTHHLVLNEFWENPREFQHDLVHHLLVFSRCIKPHHCELVVDRGDDLGHGILHRLGQRLVIFASEFGFSSLPSG